MYSGSIMSSRFLSTQTCNKKMSIFTLNKNYLTRNFPRRSSKCKEPKKKNLFCDHYFGKVSGGPQKIAFNLHLTTTSTTYHASHTLNYGFNAVDLTLLLMQLCEMSTLNKNNIFSQLLSSEPKFSDFHSPLNSERQPHHA